MKRKILTNSQAQHTVTSDNLTLSADFQSFFLTSLQQITVPMQKAGIMPQQKKQYTPDG